MDSLSRTLYDEIRRVAAGQIRGDRALRSICATDLAHEALERALRQKAGEGVERGELLGRVSRICRQVLVDRARRRDAVRRGGGRELAPLDVEAPADERMAPLDMLVLDDALEKLGRLNERHASIVEMRFFGGLQMTEIAAALGVSLRLVEKEWRKARAWLELALDERDQNERS